MSVSPSTTLSEPHPRRHAGQLQEASGLTWRLDPGLVFGHSVQRVISGAKEEAGSSVYPQLIPGTAGTRGDRWEGKKDQKPSGISVQGGTQLSLYMDLSLCCWGKTLRSNQDWETTFLLTEIGRNLHQYSRQVLSLCAERFCYALTQKTQHLIRKPRCQSHVFLLY